MRFRSVFLIGTLLLAACSGNKSTGPSAITLLDATVPLGAGKLCSSDASIMDFNGVANTRVTVTATGAGMTLRVVLYHPDFATQLAVVTTASPASIVQTLTTTGAHHLVFCEVNGVAGNVRLTVTQN